VISKKRILILVLVVPIITALFPSLSHAAMGASCQFATYAKNIKFSDDWNTAPKISTSSDTIEPGGSVKAWLVSSGWPCPPYSWNIGGRGYEVAPLATYGIGKTVTITCPGGT